MRTTLIRLWIQVTADKKKFGVLCILAIAVLLFWARLLIVSRIEKTAYADTTANSPDEDTEETSDRRAYPVIRVAMDDRPMRDPFVISDWYFPKTTEVGPNPPDLPKTVVDVPEDPEVIRARRRERFQSLVDDLTLNAVLQEGVAVIDDETYRLDEQVPGGELLFRLVELRQRSVVLEIEGEQFELNMKLGG